jgi:hypothetical protein
LCFKVGEDSIAGITIRHNLATSVDVSLIPNLLENPPNTLHEAQIHRFIVIIEIDPPSAAVYYLSPI